ncbi:hypothetical protein PENSPDRAFT_652237, partial [Peniophora sp. CONT]
MEFSRTQSAARDSGPNPEDVEVEEGSDSGYESGPASAGTSTAQDDQVIFVRALRGKKRPFKRIKISANAKPKDLKEDESDDDVESVLSFESVGDFSPREDFLIPVLNFILENSDVDMAIVHDDEYSTYCQLLQSGSPPPIDSVQRCIEDGLTFGTLNKHRNLDFASHESLMDLKSIGKEKQRSTADEPSAMPDPDPMVVLWSAKSCRLEVNAPVDRHYAHSYAPPQHDAHIHSQSIPRQVAALNLPRQLQRPALKEVPKDNITAVDPSLMAVPIEYIRQDVQQRGEEFHSTASRALSSSRRQAHISHIPQAEYVRVMGSTVPTHILAVYSSTPTTDTVMLYATHALPLTVACAMLPRLPVSRPQPRSDGHCHRPRL